MTWVYLSPHFDDVALSCGGLIWEQIRTGLKTAIWTICAGDPPPGSLSPFAQELHARWQAEENAPARRKIEDINSCLRLGSGYRHFLIPDCIYRRNPQTSVFMYAEEAALNGPLDQGDSCIIPELAQELLAAIPADTTVVCPLALGAHVDHQLTRLAAEQLGQKLCYYADFPYVLRCQAQIEQMIALGWDSQTFPVSPDGLAAWQDAISAHRSQISTFWSSDLEMRQAIAAYLKVAGGVRLWSQPAS